MGFVRFKKYHELSQWYINRARARVSKLECCQTKELGRLNMINLEDATYARLIKWILKALELGNSNLQHLPKFLLSAYQSFMARRWPKSLDYFILAKHQAKKGSYLWTRVTTT